MNLGLNFIFPSLLYFGVNALRGNGEGDGTQRYLALLEQASAGTCPWLARKGQCCHQGIVSPRDAAPFSCMINVNLVTRWVR